MKVHSEAYDGPERRTEGKYLGKFKWIMYGWMAVLTIGLVWFGHSQRQQVNDLKTSKADIRSLQKTNCGLRQFLIRARNARAASAKNDKDPNQQATDQRAVEGYNSILRIYTVDICTKAKINRPKQIH